MGIWYCTLEDVTSAADVEYSIFFEKTARTAIEAESRLIEAAPLRRFYPIFNDTLIYNWPAYDESDSHILWLRDDLISIDSLTIAGVTLDPSYYTLRPDGGPPYRWIEIKDTSPTFFEQGDDQTTAIQIVGTTGYSESTITDGTIAETINSTSTSMVADSENLGVGSLINIGDEWIACEDRSFRVTTDTLDDNLGAAANANTFTVTSPSETFYPGEIIRIGAEKMRVDSEESGAFFVRRAVNGTSLAAHTAGSAIYRQNLFTIRRAQVGTTAASHTSGEPINIWVQPPGIRQRCVAEAITQIQQVVTGYGRTIGQGEGTREARGVGLADLRRQTDLRYRVRKRIKSI